MIEGIFWLAGALAGGVFAYLAALSALALVATRKKAFRAPRLRRFALLVPAYNEERTIERTLRSLAAIKYPRELADIVVVADNCTDQTAQVASSLWATVLERSDKDRRGKGYALEWAFGRLLDSEKRYDAVLVVDADSTVSENCLAVLNEYLDEGRSVLQIADIPEARPGSWNTEVVRIGMTLYNIARPLGRRVLGFSAGLRGNGMCFSTDILREIPWRAYSLTEDLEYGLQLLMRGVTVTFVPEATVLAVSPSRIENAATQRERWEAGRFSVVRRYAPKLLRESVRQKSLKIFDAMIDLLILPFVNMFALSLLGGAVAVGFYAVGIVDTVAILWLWSVAVGLGVVHVVLGLVAARADRHLFKALVYVPRYCLWKFSLYGNLILYGIRKDWIRTARD